MIALTHTVSQEINQCELSYLDRDPIDLELAVKQHDTYCRLLENHGLRVVELSVNENFPDGTFIEDTAVVVDEIAVMTRPGAESRRGEIAGIEPELAKYRQISRITAPATLEGGDVLRIGRKLFVGHSPRTNREGVEAFRRIFLPFDYEVLPVNLKDCLHLKSAVTALDDQMVLMNPNWLDQEPFRDYRIVEIDSEESWAANVLCLPDCVVMHSGFTKTIEKVRSLEFQVETVDISELQKAESALTCSSILIEE